MSASDEDLSPKQIIARAMKQNRRRQKAKRIKEESVAAAVAKLAQKSYLKELENQTHSYRAIKMIMDEMTDAWRDVT